MIYYSNTNLTTPHMTFIGRWSPFHKGHVAIMRKKLLENPNKPILILVRNTSTDAYSPVARAHYLKIWMEKNCIHGTIMIIPNVEGVYWGRSVGYHVGLVDVDDRTKKISSTDIRQSIKEKKENWKTLVAEPNTSHLLSTKTTEIIERGMVVWLTGCPSSGKTTIATAFVKRVHAQYPQLKTQLLDGDIMRSSPIASNVGFSKQERADHILKMAYLAKIIADHGILVVCAFVSPDKKIRAKAKKIIGAKRFIEVYVKASLSVRMTRDIKGLYDKAAKGHITNLTGYNSAYEKPEKPDVFCNTDTETVFACADAINTRVFSS